jgi:heme exporter protein CcmD
VILALADTGYVALAYGAFAALVVVHVGILVRRTRSARRELRRLQERRAERVAAAAGPGSEDAGRDRVEAPA